MTNDDHDDFKAGPDDTSTIIRRLNDQLRVSLTGGKVMMTPGIIDLGLEMQARVLAAVRAFDAFTEENDPWNEHEPVDSSAAAIAAQAPKKSPAIHCFGSLPQTRMSKSAHE